MKAKTRFNAMTRRLMEACGWICDVVEHYNFYAGKTSDLFGFADLLAANPWISPGRTAAIQITDSKHKANRRKKILDSPLAFMWALCGNEIWIIHWSKEDIQRECKDGKVRAGKEWNPRVEVITTGDFPNDTGTIAMNMINLSALDAKEKLCKSDKARFISLPERR